MSCYHRMAPLALVQMVVLAWGTGELQEIMRRWDDLASGYAWPVVFGSGVTGE